MNEQKRVKLTHGSARVDVDCSEETIKALDEMSKLAYEMVSEPLNLASVTNRYLFWYDHDGKDGWTFEIDAKNYDEAYKKAYDTHGPQVADMMYQLI